jgi:hypothetical protein
MDRKVWSLCVDYSESFCTTRYELFILFDRISCRSADSLIYWQRSSAPMAYYSKTNTTFHIDSRLDLVSLSSLLLLSGDVHLNHGPVCQLNKVCEVIKPCWIVHLMVRFSPLVFPNVITGHMHFSSELLRPCCVMVFPIWLSPVAVIQFCYTPTIC